MKIDKNEQKEFLEKCHNFGGHCDCEIIFNSSDNILK